MSGPACRSLSLAGRPAEAAVSGHVDCGLFDRRGSVWKRHSRRVGARAWSEIRGRVFQNEHATRVLVRAPHL